MTASERFGRPTQAAVRTVARAAFWAVIMLSPFRLRAILASHDVPSVWHDYTDLRVFAVNLALAALLVAWAAALLAERRRPARIPSPLAAPGLVLLGLVWAGVPGSLDPPLSLAGALQLTAFAGLAWYVADEVRTPRDVAFPVALMVALQSVIAIGQVAVQGSIGLGAFGEIALDPAASGIGIVESDAGVRLLRGYGLSDHPNILGGVLSLGVIVITGALASTGGVGGGRRSRRALSLAAGLGVLALAVTFSRAAWIATVAAALAAAAVEARLHGGVHGGLHGGLRDGPTRLRAAGPWLVLAGGVTLAVGALAVPFAPFLASRLGVAATEPVAEIRSLDERVWLAGAAIDVVIEGPLLGTGLGTLPQALATSAELPYRPQPAHLVPLTIAAENGIPAAMAFCLLVGGAMALVISRAPRGGISAGAAGAAGAAMGLLVAIAVVSCFDYYPWVFPAGRTWLAVAIGAAIGLTWAPTRTATGRAPG